MNLNQYEFLRRIGVPLIMLMTLFWLLLHQPIKVYPQSTFGSVLGTVRDASGSVVPNATVKLINVDENTSRSLMTNGKGDYEAVNAKPGRYRVEVTATGFQTFTTSEVVLAARQTLRIDAALRGFAWRRGVECEGCGGQAGRVSVAQP
jgi:hypothetical protein